MACLFGHDWGWPRKRGDKHVQVCLECGSERESRVRFDAPRYRKTQEGIPNLDGDAAVRDRAGRDSHAAAA
jgi:hypothetical protein